MGMKNSRFASMWAIQKNTCDEIIELKEIDFVDLNENTLTFLNKKLEKPSVRSSFTVWIYEYVKICAMHEKIELKLIQNLRLFNKILPFMMEVGISIMYLENQNFDGKAGVTSIEKIRNNQLAASLLKDYLYSYLDENLEEEDRKIVVKNLRQMFKTINTCQYLEKNYSQQIYLNYPKRHFQNNNAFNICTDLIDFKPIIHRLIQQVPQKVDAIHHYFVRCNMFSSPMFTLITKIIFALTGYDGQEKTNLLSYAQNYGIMLQMVNDNTDFIVERGTRGKIQTDVLSDLRNRTITLPIILHLSKNKNGLIEKYMQTGDFKLIKGQHNLILKELMLSGAYREAFMVGKEIAENAERCIKYQSYNISQDLKNLVSIGWNNRFYRHYFNAKKFYKREVNHNRIYFCEENLSPISK